MSRAEGLTTCFVIESVIVDMELAGLVQLSMETWLTSLL